jgi:hypothetical protein
MIKSAPAFRCLGLHRITSDLLAEERSKASPDPARIAELAAELAEWRVAVIEWAEKDRSLPPLRRDESYALRRAASPPWADLTDRTPRP